ncbi:MAG: Flp pilus assembly protein CpaB [Devosia sp.]
MKPSRIVLLLVAILAGGLAAFLATRGDRPVQVVQGPETVIEEAKIQILVAATPIGVGERLTAQTLEWQDWPEGAVRPEYVTIAAMPDAITEMSGAVARFEFFPGEPIREQKLVRTDQGYLSAVLAKGMRGVSIAVTADSASGGFIVPNDHVDVIMTRDGENGQASEMLLQNVKVLAIGNRLGEIGATGAPADPENPRTEVFADQAIATLELDPVQAEAVINASRIGQLSLALRSIADFTEAAGEVRRRPSNQTVRVIKYGQETNVMAGGTTPAAAPPTVVDPASYTPPEPAAEEPPAPQVERQ